MFLGNQELAEAEKNLVKEADKIIMPKIDILLK
jgi:hypothetical protein